MRSHARATMLLIFTMALGMALAAGCSDPAPIERAAQGVAQGGETDPREGTQKPAVIATTSGTPLASEATAGVASTAGQSEISSVAEAPVAEAQTASAPTSKTRTEASSEESFTAVPQADGGDGYGADSVLGVRYGIHEGYERVVVDFGTGEEPAWSVPEWTLSTPTGDGTLRVTLPSISTTGVSDGVFDGPLLKNFHVVRAPDGGMFVDTFADSTFIYRVIELSDPGRLVVDFKPASAELEALPALAANTVLEQPRSGARVGGSLTVSGYSRNLEATNTIILTNAAGKTIVQETVMSNDWTVTWGYFETTLKVPNFSGEGTLKVGAQSARNSTFEGVKIPVYGS